MFVGKERRGEEWTDLLAKEKQGTEHVDVIVIIDDEGYGKFAIDGYGVGVWISEAATKEQKERSGAGLL